MKVHYKRIAHWTYIVTLSGVEYTIHADREFEPPTFKWDEAECKRILNGYNDAKDTYQIFGLVKTVRRYRGEKIVEYGRPKKRISKSDKYYVDKSLAIMANLEASVKDINEYNQLCKDLKELHRQAHEWYTNSKRMAEARSLLKLYGLSEWEKIDYMDTPYPKVPAKPAVIYIRNEYAPVLAVSPSMTQRHYAALDWKDFERVYKKGMAPQPIGDPPKGNKKSSWHYAWNWRKEYAY